MSTITAGAESLGEVEQAVASARPSGRGRDLAIIVSIGVAEAAWCALLGYAIWALVF